MKNGCALCRNRHRVSPSAAELEPHSYDRQGTAAYMCSASCAFISVLFMQYRNLASTVKTRFENEQFIELFDVDLVTLPQHLPAWFVFNQKLMVRDRSCLCYQAACWQLSNHYHLGIIGSRADSADQGRVLSWIQATDQNDRVGRRYGNCASLSEVLLRAARPTHVSFCQILREKEYHR